MQEDKEIRGKIEEFVRGLMAEKGELATTESVNALAELLEEKMQVATIAALPDDRFVAFEQESQKDEPDENVLDELIEGANLNMQEILEGVFREFQEEYLEGGER